MRLSTFELENFRKFNNKKISFKESSTIIYGENSSGKSTIVTGIDLLFFNILQKAGGDKVKASKAIYDIDVKNGKIATSITGTIRIEEEYFKVNLNHILKRKKDVLDTNRNFIASDSFKLKYLGDEDENMPIYASYNLENLNTKVNIGNKIYDFTKESAFENTGSEKFFTWIKSFIRNNNDLKELNKIKETIYNFNGEINNIDFKNDGKKTILDIRKEQLEFNQLSYSEKMQVVLVGDIARRLYTANPSTVNPFVGKGVVVIDNLDVFFNKELQEVYLKNLISIFPNIQFIVTTMSKIVLKSCSERVNVIKL